MRGFYVYVFRHGECHDQLFRFWILLLEATQRDDGEDIYARSHKQALVVFEHTDNFVDAAVDAHRLAKSVSVGEERFADGRAEHDYWPRVLLVERADEASTLDAEQRNRVRVHGLSAAQNNFLHAAVAADNPVTVTEEEAARAKCGDDLHVRGSLPDKLRVVVFKILARSNPLWQAGKVRAERESRDEIRA